MKGLKNGIKFLALFMAVIMVFATGAFVTSHSFKAGEADDSDIYYTSDDLLQDYMYVYADDEDYDDFDEYDDDDDFGDEDEDFDDDDDDDDDDDEFYDDDDDLSDELSGEEEVLMPAGYLEAGTASGVIVSADFGEGVFPEGTELKAKDVSSEKALESIRRILPEASEAVAVDVSFYDEDGNELHCTESGRVSLEVRLAEALSSPEVSLVHIDGEGSVYEISGSASVNGASFRADSFSVFALAGSGSDLTVTEENAAGTQDADPATTVTEESVAAQEEQQPASAEEQRGGLDVSITAATASKPYDKVPVSARDLIKSVTVNGAAADSYSFGDNSLLVTSQGNDYVVEGITVETLIDGNAADVVNVGRYEIAVKGAGSAVIKNGDQTVSGTVSVENGFYEVTRREIILTSGSGEWFYDGREHKAELVAASGDGWLEGDEPQYSFTGSQKSIGDSENYFVRREDSGSKVTDWAKAFPNYNVIVCYGRLSVIPNPGH